MVKGGTAHQAGLEDDDIVVEVNGVNVEQTSHGEVVGMIRTSGNSLEMLVASKNVYEQLKAKEVAITSQLLGKAPRGPIHTEDQEKPEEETRPATPAEPEKQRVRDFVFL